MEGFLYKNLQLSKSLIALLFVVQFCLAAGVCVVSLNGRGTEAEEFFCLIFPMGYYVVMFLLANAVSSIFFADEEKLSWKCFAVSAPQGIKASVQAKYLSILFLNLLILSWCVLADAVFVVIFQRMEFSQMTVIFLLFCWNLIKQSVSLPFVYRYGLSYGNSVRRLLLILVAGMIGIYLLFGDISFLMGKSFSEFLQGLFADDRSIWLLALIPYAAAGAYYLSYRICAALYRKGIENYES